MQAVAGVSIPADTATTAFDNRSITDMELKSNDSVPQMTTMGEGASSFVIPEGLSADIDSLLTTWQARNLLNVLDCNDEGWRDIKTSDTTFAERLQNIPSIIKMPYNSVVRACIDRYITRNRSLMPIDLSIEVCFPFRFHGFCVHGLANGVLSVQGTRTGLEFKPFLKKQQRKRGANS